MLIKFGDLVNKYKLRPKGIIHIGAHKAEELNDYLASRVFDIVWVEGNEKLYSALKDKLKFLTENKVFNAIISDKDDQEIIFHITNNGESSSILELERHKIHHPQIHVTESVSGKTKTFDTLANENKLDLSKYDFLNLDIQGAELMALKGMPDTLKTIKYVYTEVNTGEVYKNCAKIEELDEYLKTFGFDRVETHITEYEWGDAFYIKK